MPKMLKTQSEKLTNQFPQEVLSCGILVLKSGQILDN